MKVPVLPVRDTVHFPGVIQTLLIGRDMSLRALHESLERGRETLVLSQRNTRSTSRLPRTFTGSAR